MPNNAKRHWSICEKEITRRYTKVVPDKDGEQSVGKKRKFTTIKQGIEFTFWKYPRIFTRRFCTEVKVSERRQ